MDEGVSEDCFVEIALDKKKWLKYRNPNELYDYVLTHTGDPEKRYYVFIDEIQLSHKLASTAGSLLGASTSDNTIKNYLDYLEDAFLF